ncbi:glutaredoxin [Coemansia sp. RSA 1722]|nr:glutaredoxin [Coemansia sp. RSA 485]KAJ2591950.1 glutaredoxin [Coemansia sp. RSA 1722]KAJ2598698.1 glutaredoxin [Coemansia sp. RSA 1721]KAJ2634775.1 glutaredoxin [Coemansia sp. RSA 1286]KAJ2698196.1 glutaredoxin [Coemansia sp. IMI 203386]
MSKSDNVIQVQDEKELRLALEEKSHEVVIYFWASWAEQCKQIESVIDDLATKYSKTQFFKIEAENFEGISEAYEINAVPTVIVAKKAKILARVEGANVAEVVQQIAANCGAANGIGSQQPAAESSSEFKQDLNTRLKGLIERAPVMVFIKGTAAQPRCGFSKKIVNMLNEQNIKYGYFDILTDEQVRQGLKEYSDWPTYPQLYIGGELVGGVDIVSEMIESGELVDMVPEDSIAK